MKNDLATKADIQNALETSEKNLRSEIALTKTELRDEIATSEKNLRSEIALTKTELRDEIGMSEKNLRSEITSVKEELNAKIDSVKTELQQNIDHVAAEVVRLSIVTQQNHNILLNAIDGLARTFTDTQTEKAAVDHALRRHDNKLENHETRIGVLEGK